MFLRVKNIFLAVLVLGSLLAAAAPVFAAEASQCQKVGWLESAKIGDGVLIPCDCTDSDINTECDLNDVFQTIINFSQLILALTGMVALLAFMYGGVLWIIAAGNQDLVQKGKNALIAAAIGLIVVLSSWVIVNFTINALTGGDIGNVKIFGRSWFGAPSGGDSTGSQKPGQMWEPSRDQGDSGDYWDDYFGPN